MAWGRISGFSIDFQVFNVVLIALWYYSASVWWAVHHKSKKWATHGYNCVNSWSICKILSLLQRATNFKQSSH